MKKIKPSRASKEIAENWTDRFESIFKKRHYGTLKDKENKNKIRKL